MSSLFGIDIEREIAVDANFDRAARAKGVILVQTQWPTPFAIALINQLQRAIEDFNPREYHAMFATLHAATMYCANREWPIRGEIIQRGDLVYDPNGRIQLEEANPCIMRADRPWPQMTPEQVKEIVDKIEADERNPDIVI